MLFGLVLGLVERWEQLQSRAEELPRVRGFQKEMAALKEELEILVARIVPTQDEAIHSTQELEARIGQVEVRRYPNLLADLHTLHLLPPIQIFVAGLGYLQRALIHVFNMIKRLVFYSAHTPSLQ